MDRSDLNQKALSNASTVVARSICELGNIEVKLIYTDPSSAKLLSNQINRLKIGLKEVEKARILQEEDDQRKASLIRVLEYPSSSSYFFTTELSVNVREIQCQAAKLEVLEMLYSVAKRQEPSLEVELAYNMISTLRQSLHAACESCFEAFDDDEEPPVADLKSTVTSVSSFLSQTISGFTSGEPQVLFLKEMLIDIVSKLVRLNSALDS
jgi:hypothetical protein